MDSSVVEACLGLLADLCFTFPFSLCTPWEEKKGVLMWFSCWTWKIKYLLRFAIYSTFMGCLISDMTKYSLCCGSFNFSSFWKSANNPTFSLYSYTAPNLSFNLIPYFLSLDYLSTLEVEVELLTCTGPSAYPFLMVTPSHRKYLLNAFYMFHQ